MLDTETGECNSGRDSVSVWRRKRKQKKQHKKETADMLGRGGEGRKAGVENFFSIKSIKIKLKR